MRTKKAKRADGATLGEADVSSPAIVVAQSGSIASPTVLSRKRRASFIIWILVSIAVLLLLAGAGWLYLDILDKENAQYVPIGVTLNGASLAGMSRAEVTEAVESIIDSHMTHIITVEVPEATIPFDVGSYVSTDPLILTNEIMEVRLNTPLWERLRHDYFDEPIPVAFETGYLIDSEAIQSLAETIAADFSIPAKSAFLWFDGFTPRISGSETGTRIIADETAATIEGAILDSLNDKDVTWIHASSEMTIPEVQNEDLMVPVLTASINQRKVMLWNGDELVKTYPCAVGRPAYPTIPGEYYIGAKEINPPWYNPDPEGWGEDMPDFIPGPNDALGARGLHIFTMAGYNTMMLFHGALAADMAGTATTHGCLRMFNSDVIDLYDRVPIGTRVSLAP